MGPLSIQVIQTKIFREGESLTEFIVNSVSRELVSEGMVLAVTSKIVSLHEGRHLKKSETSKRALIEQEADVFLGEIAHGCCLTVKEGLLIATAGIDESNSEAGNYILYPRDPFRSALGLWAHLREAWGLEHLGILLTDSHTSALRRGVTGISLSHAGFRALKDMIGKKDLFGRSLRMTQVNCADGLAAAAVMMMGEGDECQPLALIKNAPVDFLKCADEMNAQEIRVPLQDDLYFPLLKAFQDSQ